MGILQRPTRGDGIRKRTHVRQNPRIPARRIVAKRPLGLWRRYCHDQFAALQVLVDRRQVTVVLESVLTCDPDYRGRVARDRSFAGCVQQAMAEGDFDLVQSHERIPGCTLYRAGDGVHAAWLKHRARLLNPLQCLAQRLDPYHRYVLQAEREMFLHPHLRAVICNSRLVQDEIVAHFGLPREKLPIIRNGVDLDAFHLQAVDSAAASPDAVGIDAINCRSCGVARSSRVSVILRIWMASPYCLASIFSSASVAMRLNWAIRFCCIMNAAVKGGANAALHP